MTGFNEENAVEQPVIDAMVDVGWTYRSGPSLARTTPPTAPRAAAAASAGAAPPTGAGALRRAREPRARRAAAALGARRLDEIAARSMGR